MTHFQTVRKQGNPTKSIRKLSALFLNPLLAIVIAIGAPLVIGLYLAYQQSLATEIQIAQIYAQDMQGRLKDSNDQGAQVFKLLAAAGHAPCSPENLALMRKLDLVSNHLQTVGHVVDNHLVCSSYGAQEPIPLGPVGIEHSNGIKIRLNVSLPNTDDTKFVVVERDNYAVVIEQGHYTDINTGRAKVILGQFSTETGDITLTKGEFRPEWITLFNEGFDKHYVADGYILAGARSEGHLVASVATVPLANIKTILLDKALILFPTAVISALVLVLVVLELMAQRTTLQQTSHQLGERVKELSLIHAVARLTLERFADKRELLAKIVELIPTAMQFPELCQARIVCGEQEISTPGWQPSRWNLVHHFTAGDDSQCRIEVAYSAAPPSPQLFLPEEYDLVRSVAEMVTSYLTRQQAEAQVSRLAYFEPVTGLPNRASLEKLLAQKMAGATQYHASMALLMISVSGFRDVVSTLGFTTGDELLRHVANALNHSQDKKHIDLVASLGGDEFVLVTSQPGIASSIPARVADILASLEHPAIISGIPIKLDVAIGVVIYPEHGETPDLLLRRGDIALQAAKTGHRNHLLYSADIDNYKPERIALLGELPDAIRNNQLVLHYQPKIAIESGKTVGVEALVRWQHPERGLIFPDQFIPLAEQTQIINPLTRWVLDEALRQCQVWREQGFDLEMSINLSIRNLLDSQLCEAIPDMARARGIALDRLVLEITETAVMSDPEQCRRLMDNLHQRGVVFSIDDFGIGQSSLGYIRDLHIHRLKIDKSFVINFDQPRNAAIVNAAINLGHSLGMEVTAEGIENEQTLKALQAMGCDIGQGYFISKGLPADRLTAWLRESPFGYRELPESTAGA